MLKPTEGPWKVEKEDFGAISIVSGIDNRVGGVTIYNTEANARLIVSACNSYQKHCSDPVKCAEEDLLGEALEACNECIDLMIAYETKLAPKTHEILKKIQKVLAKAKGGK